MTRTHYDPQWLQAMVTVAQTGNVSRAAEILCLSQPALSLQLKALRLAVGVALFKRHAQGMQLTPAGAALLPHAQHAIDGMARFAHAVTECRDSLHGVVRIGTVVDPGFLRLGAFLQHLNQMAPQVEPQLFHGMSGDALDGVASGRLDAGFYLGAWQEAGQDAGESLFFKKADAQAHVQWRHITHMNYRVIAPVAWADRLNGANWSSLVQQTWLQPHERSVHHRLLMEAWRSIRLPSEGIQWSAKVDQEPVMLSLVQAGIGLSLMPEWVALRESQLGNVHMIDGLDLPCVLGFAWCTSHRNHKFSDLLERALYKTWQIAV